MGSLEARAHVWSQHAQAREALAAVLDAFARAEPPIAALPVKGIVTARLWYDDASERPIQDVDLRVRPGDLARACDVAAARGWRRVASSRAYGLAAFDVEHTLVELETHVGPPGLCNLSVDAMLARAEPGSARGVPHLVPEVHDHVLLLCVNAFKDKLVDAPVGVVGAVADLLRAPAREPRLAADRLATLAATSGSATLTALTASWLLDRLSEGEDGPRDARARGFWSEVVGSLAARGAPRRPYAALLRAASSGRARRVVLATLVTRVAGDRPRDRARGAAALAAYAVERGLAHGLAAARGGRSRPPDTG